MSEVGNYSEVVAMAGLARVSVAKLGREADISPATLTNWKKGVKPSPALWGRIERAAARLRNSHIKSLEMSVAG